MSVIESVIQKFINNSIRTSYGKNQTTARSRARYRPGCGDGSLGVTGRRDQQRKRNSKGHNTDPDISGRDVHLTGFDRHEDVVRAYLEFSGIDPHSREGQFYFDL